MKSQILFGISLLVVTVSSDSDIGFDSNIMSAMMYMMSNGGGGSTSPARYNTLSSTLGRTTSCTDSRGRIYRTADGTCNNIKNPTQGSSMDRFKRNVKAQYNDRSQEPRIKGRCLYKTDNGCYRPNLPSARAVSVVVHSPDMKNVVADIPTLSKPSSSLSITDLLGAIGADTQPAPSISQTSSKGSINDLLEIIGQQSTGKMDYSTMSESVSTSETMSTSETVSTSERMSPSESVSPSDPSDVMSPIEPVSPMESMRGILGRIGQLPSDKMDLSPVPERESTKQDMSPEPKPDPVQPDTTQPDTTQILLDLVTRLVSSKESPSESTSGILGRVGQLPSDKMDESSRPDMTPTKQEMSPEPKPDPVKPDTGTESTNILIDLVTKLVRAILPGSMGKKEDSMTPDTGEGTPSDGPNSSSGLLGLVRDGPQDTDSMMPDGSYPGDPEPRSRYPEDYDRYPGDDRRERGRRPGDRRRDRDRRPGYRRRDRNRERDDRRDSYRERDDRRRDRDRRPDDRRRDRDGRPDDRRRDRDRRPDDRGRDRDRRPDDRRRGRDRRPDDRRRDRDGRLSERPDDRKPDDRGRDRRPDGRDGRPDGRSPDDRSSSGLKGMVRDQQKPDDRTPDDRSSSGLKGMVRDPKKPDDRRPDDRTPDDRSSSGLKGMVRDPQKPDDRRPEDRRPDDRSSSGLKGMVRDQMNPDDRRPDDRSSSGLKGMVRDPMKPDDRRPEDRRPDDRSSSGLKGMVRDPKKPDDRRPDDRTPDDRSSSGLKGMVRDPMKPDDRRPDDRSSSGLKGMVRDPMKPDDRRPDDRSGLKGMVRPDDRSKKPDDTGRDMLPDYMKPDDRSSSGLKGIVRDPMRPDEGRLIDPLRPDYMKPDDRSSSGLKGLFGDPTRPDYMKPDDRSSSGLKGLVRDPMRPGDVDLSSGLKGLFGEPQTPDNGIDIYGPYGPGSNLVLPGRGLSVVKEEYMVSSRYEVKRTDLLRLMTIFIEHEVTATAVEISDNMKDCCTSNAAYRSKDCFPIPVPLNDRRFKQKCLNFLRSRSVSSIISNKNPREQQNMISAFIDGSAIYGSDIVTQNSLRDVDGYMLTSEGNLLPRGDDRLCRLTYNRYFCFKAGDDRLNLQPGLIIIHTMFVRIHNKIVASFQGTTMTGERKFQEARRIVIALLQKFVYEEYLPEILSTKYIQKYKLDKYTYEYDPTIEVRISNVFATAAIKFVDALTPDTIVIRGQKIRLRETYNNPEMVFEELAELIEEMLMQPTEERNRFITAELTDHFLEYGSTSYDEVANTIQRGRDHGLPPYNWFRQSCGLPIIRSFNSRALGDAGPVLRKVYKNVNDIDVYTGAMSEPNLPGSLLGETFSCIIARQFRDLKFGDSFFYLSEDPQRGFTREQRIELSQVTLSTAMCAVFELEQIQDNPFRVPSARNPMRDCESMVNFLSFLGEEEGPRSSLLPSITNAGEAPEYETEGEGARPSPMPSYTDKLSSYGLKPRIFDSEKEPSGPGSGLLSRMFPGESRIYRPVVGGGKEVEREEVEAPIAGPNMGKGGGGEVEKEDPEIGVGISSPVGPGTGALGIVAEGNSGLLPRVFSPDGTPMEMGQMSGITELTYTDGSERGRMSQVGAPGTSVTSDPTYLPGVPLYLQPKSQAVSGTGVGGSAAGGVEAGDAAEKAKERMEERPTGVGSVSAAGILQVGLPGEEGGVGEGALGIGAAVSHGGAVSHGVAGGHGDDGQSSAGPAGVVDDSGRSGGKVDSDRDCCSDNSDDSNCSDDDKKDCKKSDK